MDREELLKFYFQLENYAKENGGFIVLGNDSYYVIYYPEKTENKFNIYYPDRVFETSLKTTKECSNLCNLS